MSSWQKRARLGVAAFGVASAVAVYLAIGDRPRPRAAAEAPRLDPHAILEAVGGRLEQVSGARREFVIQSERTITYDDGTKGLVGVQIETTNNGRRFVVTAGQGRAAKDDSEIELIGGILLRESDGFELRTDHGVFRQQEGVVRTDADVAFTKGLMSGSGHGMVYAQHTDVLTIDSAAQVDVAATAASDRLRFSAGTAALDRQQHLLTLQGAAHVEHGPQVTDADSAVAQLSPADDVVTFVALRGGARVSGGPAPLSRMDAASIDLDYTDDGARLERVVLTGSARVELRQAEAATARQFGGEVLDLQLGDDGSITRLTGSGGVRMVVPASAEAPARQIASRTFGATGAGQTFSALRFDDEVAFEESVPGRAPRTVRARTLTLDMAADAIREAVFEGGVTFDDGRFTGGGAQAHYAPSEASVRLSGREARGRPYIADSRLHVDADRIDVGLETRRIEAAGQVKASLRAGGQDSRGSGEESATRLPGLLRSGEPATVLSDTLAYAAETGAALFTGTARIWQGETEIRGDAIDLQQGTGDLVARGHARTALMFDTGASTGEAEEIRYRDADRVITYAAPARSADPTDRVHLVGSEGDLRAASIEVRLASGAGRVERVEARRDVSAIVNGRTVTGASLDYDAAADRYEVRAGPSVPVTVEESCRVTRARTLTWSRSTDTMSVDGRTDFRTRDTRRSGCAEPPR